MLGDPLVYSFQVDTFSSSLGFPFCAQGQQPSFIKPRFTPEQIKPFLRTEEIDEILDRLNKIFHATGCPPFPLFIIPALTMFLIVVPIMISAFSGHYSPLVYISFLLVFPTFFVCIGIFFWMSSSRKTQIKAAVNQWNSTFGGPRGLYFNLGDTSGDSEAMFWQSVYPRRIRLNRHTSLVIQSKGFLHLYTNPTARKHWCDQNGEQFVLPPPVQQVVSGYEAPPQIPPPAYSLQHQVPGHGFQHPPPLYAVPQYQVQDHHPGHQAEHQVNNFAPPNYQGYSQQQEFSHDYGQVNNGFNMDNKH